MAASPISAVSSALTSATMAVSHHQHVPVIVAVEDENTSLLVTASNTFSSNVYVSAPPVTPLSSTPFSSDDSRASAPTTPATGPVHTITGLGPGPVSIDSTFEMSSTSSMMSMTMSSSSSMNTMETSGGLGNTVPVPLSTMGSGGSSSMSASTSSSTGSSNAPRPLSAGTLAVLAAGVLGVFGAMIVL